MNKRKELKEVLKAHMQKAHKSGKLKEDWVSNWINQIFDKTTKRSLKNDPILKDLHKKLTKDTKIFFKAMEKRYGGAENFPEYIKDDLKDVGYPGY